MLTSKFLLYIILPIFLYVVLCELIVEQYFQPFSGGSMKEK